jgi:hypothetical protein
MKTDLAKAVTEFNVGDRVEFYGGEFEIVEVRESRGHIKGCAAYGRLADFVGPSPVAYARGKFIGGRAALDYFGPDKDFVFQGNALSRYAVTRH